MPLREEVELFPFWWFISYSSPHSQTSYMSGLTVELWNEKYPWRWEQLPDCFGGRGTLPSPAPPLCYKPNETRRNNFKALEADGDVGGIFHMCQKVLSVPVLNKLRGVQVCFIWERTDQCRIEQGHQLWWRDKNENESATIIFKYKWWTFSSSFF